MIPAIASVAWATPSVDEPPVSGASNPSDRAVVVGNEVYTGFPKVAYATRDADASWLVRTRGLSPTSVVRLGDATRRAMVDAIDRAAADTPAAGTLWVYFAGHGLGLSTGAGSPERAFLGINAIARAEEIPDYALPLPELERLVADSRAARVVVVVDACFNNAGRGGGALVDGRFAVPVGALGPSDRVTVWTATRADQTTVPYEPAQHGAFTYFAIGALSGWADGESGTPDGRVDLPEAHAWVTRALSSVGILGATPELVGSAASFAVSAGKLTSPPRDPFPSAGAPPSAVQTAPAAVSPKVAFVEGQPATSSILGTLAWIPPGRFASGDRTVELARGLHLMATEVTQRMYKQVVGINPSTPEYRGLNLIGPELPVQNVRVSDMIAFANRASELDGLPRCYVDVGGVFRQDAECVGYRLPSSIEWERAARPGGEKYAGTNRDADVCRYGNVADRSLRVAVPDWTTVWFECEDGYASLAPVGSFEPTAFGVYDLTGNVWEVVANSASPSGYAFRGCAHFDDPPHAYLSNENWHQDLTWAGGNLGFRLVRATPVEW